MLGLAVGGAGCEACRTPTSPPVLRAEKAETGAPSQPVGEPTARIYLVSDVAGALEPCGCVKDQRGGIDRFGALVEKDAIVLSAGPLFFMDMDLSPERRSQETEKARTIAATLAGLNLAAFAPGRNDWAAGEGELVSLSGATGAKLLASNVVPPVREAGPSANPGLAYVIKSVGGLRVGIVGVAAPDHAKLPLEGVTSSKPSEEAKRAAAEAAKAGAQCIIVLAAVGRGEAKRIADAVPEALAVVVGSAGNGGENNTEAAPIEQVGKTLIIETANHLQTVGVLDLFVRDAGSKASAGLVSFADATGIDRLRRREKITARIDQLRAKIATWSNDPKILPKDLDARKTDLQRAETELQGLDEVQAPADGSFYRYTVRELREDLGTSKPVHDQMLAYYKKINDANRLEFKDRAPKAAAKGEASYVGVDACTHCHEDERKVWDKTAHAHAYATLANQFKEYNLDCVSCHVTGYDRPGGSTVTHVRDLKNVQCEVCHGPGKLHAQNPRQVAVPVPIPPPESCLECHRPPHVHIFDPLSKTPEILGPGHGWPK